MARDYSARRNSAREGTNKSKRRPAKSRAPAKPNKPARRSGPPGWVWMLIGLCIGLMIAAAFYVFGRPAPVGDSNRIDLPAPERVSSEQSIEPGPGEPEPAPRESEPRFSFYEMLPNYEVVIPEEEYPEPEPAASESDAAEAPPSAPSAAAESPQPTTPRVEEPGRYVIQAGAFSSPEDAERRKAELGLLGLATRIVEVELESGRTVYRVQSQTIDNSEELNEMLRRLRENRIDTLVMRARE